jgi:hypothetical protein
MSKGTTSAVQTLTPTVQTSAYTAGQCVGGLLRFPGFFCGGKSTGVLLDLAVKEIGTQKPGLTILVFSARPAGTFTDGAAPTLSAADWALVTAIVNVATTDYTSVDATHQCAVKNPSLAVRGEAPDPQGGAGDLHLVALATGTPTLGSATALSLSVGGLMDV